MKCNKRLKYCNYVAFSHFHGTAVNNSGLIYKNRFEKEATLKIKAQDGSSYEVIVNNTGVNSLKYNIKIKSYIR